MGGFPSPTKRDGLDHGTTNVVFPQHLRLAPFFRAGISVGGAVPCRIYFARRVESSIRLTVQFAYRRDILRLENLIGG